VAKPRKLYLKAMNNPRGLRFAEFTALIEAFGFVLDRQRGSHRIYAREDVREFVNVQPQRDGKAKAAQVESFLALVQQYGLSLEDDGP
jgi:predicted RNA binding protein YcfA (HicA-like mRNA interferase family)